MEQTKTAVGTRQIKIIGAGFGRTGTLSLKAALEELGFGPCYHMTEVFFNHPEHASVWEAAAKGETVNWQELLKGYQATVDWPGCTFYKELMESYPDAKVLLTVRNPEQWYESTLDTIYEATNSEPVLLTSLPPGLRRPDVLKTRQMIQMLVWERTFNRDFENQSHAIKTFNQHIEEVKKVVPPERLLVYNVKEGWGPLCAFLGVEVPRHLPFPHLNDRVNFRERTRQRSRATIGQRLLLAASAILALSFLFRRKKRK